MSKNKFHILGWAIALCSLSLTSCGDDYPGADVQPYDTDVLSIKIVNAGANGSEVVEGTIDEVNKIINFPRLDPATNFSSLKVEATLSAEATLEKSVFDFSMDDSDAFKTLLLRVNNHKRYKDYFIRVRKKIPVFGADFELPTVTNFSGDNIYADYKSLLTRCADFDGTYVLIVSRATSPHILKVSDLQNGTISPIVLDKTGVIGGTYPYNMGALANGHIYIASLSGSKASPLKIYYWEDPTATPQLIANINVANIPDAGNRHGDNMSLNIDKNGNGFIYFGDNASTKILRLTVTGHKTINTPTVLTSSSNATMVTNVYRIEDTQQYIWSGVRLSSILTDEGLNPKYTINKNNIAAEGAAARIFTFNKSRYLMMCSAGLGSASKATPALYVYDITKGNTIEEALTNFDNGTNHNPVYTFFLGGSGNAAPIVQTNYYIEKDSQGNDSKLYLFASRADSGFAICEFPIKKSDD